MDPRVNDGTVKSRKIYIEADPIVAQSSVSYSILFSCLF